MPEIEGVAVETHAAGLRPGEARRGAPLEIELTPTRVVVGAMGWLREYPDFRDYGASNEKVKAMMSRAGVVDRPESLPGRVDLSAWCSPIENQGSLGSCTAHAGASLYEYFERRAFGRYVDVSRLFLYKTTRNLLKWSGDTGAYLRSTMGAMALFGLPPEDYWPYDVERVDVEPSPFCYAFAERFQALVYHRLDPVGTAPAALLAYVKANLAAGLPAMFGFTVYDSIRQAASSGAVPFPAAGERVVGGHAVLAVGYDDSKEIRNTGPNEQPTRGALLIRNSWGNGWGERGYGWLPYAFVEHGLAVDWWTMLKGEWIDTGAFGLGIQH